MSIKLPVSLAVLAAACIASNASASNIFLTDVSPKTSMTVTFPGLSAETTDYVGKINWSFDRSDSANAGLDSIIAGTTVSTFCIEGTQNVYIGQTASFANLFADISQAPKDNVGNTFQMNAKAGAITMFWDDYYDQATQNNVNAAAFQLGIWELLYDSSPNLTSGLFQAAPTADADSILAFNEAQVWLSNYTIVAPTGQYQLYAFSDPNLQDQLFGVPLGGGSSPTPLPAALPGGLALIAALGLYRKLRTQ
jgi:hypothetical protein